MTKRKTPVKKASKEPAVPEESPFYRIVFENTAAALAVIREDGVIMLVNPRFGELIGYPQDEIEGKKHWKELVAPNQADIISLLVRDIMNPAGHVPPACAFDLLDRSGRRIPVLLAVRPIPGSRQVIATVTENRIQKRFEEMLRTTENRYRTLAGIVPAGVFRNKIDPPGRLLWGNPALVRMYGFDSLALMLKRSPASLYADPRDRDRLLAELADKGSVHNFTVRQKRADGSTFWARISARSVTNREGSMAMIEGITEDLTTELAAQESADHHYRAASQALNAVTGIGICITGPDGTITLANQGLLDMLGYTGQELIGKETPLLFHTEQELAARGRELGGKTGQPVSGLEVLTMTAGNGGSTAGEWTYVAKEGRQIRVSLTVTRFDAGGEETPGYLFVAREIRDDREEEAIRASCNRMSGVIYNLPDAMFAIDRDGRIIAWNRAMEDITGVTAGEILGKGDHEYAIPFYGLRRPVLIDVLDRPDEEIEDLGYCSIQRRGNAVMAESPTIDPSHTLRVLWCLAAPILDRDGAVIGAVEILADVTRRRLRETALEDSVQKFREILDNTGSAILIVEDDDTISFINPEFGRTFGYVREEIEGKKKWTDFVIPEDLKRVKEQWEPVVRGESGPTRLEVQFIRWDGSARNALLTTTRIPGTRKLVVAILDITEKVRADTAIQLANRKHKILNGIIRHDILNQLTVLKGNLELSREIETDPRERTTLDKEIAATNAIHTLITFTRDYQDIGLEPPQWQDVKMIIAEAFAGIRLAPVTLDVDIAGVEIFADRQLKRVFSDLVKNALDHGERTTRIRIYAQESFEELHVICQDDGVGVPPEAKERIFRRESFTGKGLDLYLAKEILSLTGIGIRETGIFGKGAEFEIRVPRGGYRFTTTNH